MRQDTTEFIKKKRFILSAGALLLLGTYVLWGGMHRPSTVSPPPLETKTALEVSDVYNGVISSPPSDAAVIEEEILSDEQPPARTHTRIARGKRQERARENLLSDNPQARRRAAFILGRVGTDDDISAIADIVVREQDQRTQVMMIRALSRRETPESIRALGECLGSDNQRVQTAAIRSLARMKSLEAKARLQDAFEDGKINSATEKRLIERTIGTPTDSSRNLQKEQPRE